MGYLLKRCQQPRRSLPKKNGVGASLKRGTGAGAHNLYCGRAMDTTCTRRCHTASNPRLHCAGWARSAYNEKNENTEPLMVPAQAAVCGPQGPQCSDCMDCQWALPSDDPDPEVAGVDDILRLKPVKDDRVLPEELSRVLLQTRLWQSLDFDHGPPSHRCNDSEPPQGAEVWTKHTQHTFQRKALPPDTRNAEGAAVQLGTNHLTVYCGRQISQPKQLTARIGLKTGEQGNVFQWNGKCGPYDGPHCALAGGYRTACWPNAPF